MSHNGGSRLGYWIQLAKGNIISITTVQHINEDEVENEDVKE